MTYIITLLSYPVYYTIFNRIYMVLQCLHQWWLMVITYITDSLLTVRRCVAKCKPVMTPLLTVARRTFLGGKLGTQTMATENFVFGRKPTSFVLHIWNTGFRLKV